MQCQHGRLHTVQCRGILGCRDNTGAVSCDQSPAYVGDGCFLEEEGTGLCGNTDASVCRDGNFTLIRCCPACYTTPHGYVCDSTCNPV